MAKKGKFEGEEQAWEDYIASTSETPRSRKKGGPIGKIFKKLLERVGIGRKKSEIQAVKEQVSISAKEAKDKSAEKRLEEKKAGKKQKSFAESVKEIEDEQVKKQEIKQKPLGIDKYIKKVDQEKKASKELLEKKERPAEGKKASKPFFGKPVAKEKPALPKKIAAMPKALVRKVLKPVKKPVVKKKVALMPKAVPVKKVLKKAVEKIKVVKKEKVVKGAGEKVPKIVKAALAETVEPTHVLKLKALKPAQVEAILKTRPSLSEKSVPELKRLPKKTLRKEVKRQKIEKRARGWYGNGLKHKSAALSGWRIRKKVKLYSLRKKKRKGKLTKKDKIQMRRLLSDDRKLRTRVIDLQDKIMQLEKINHEKEQENEILEEKAKEAGIKIPKVVLPKIPAGKPKAVKRTDMHELVGVMKGIANEMAAVVSRKPTVGIHWKDALTVDDQINSQKRLINGLEKAFYKRQVDFKQFREKLFDYQSKLSELKLHKNIIKERKGKMPTEVRQAIESGTPTVTPKLEKALEKLAEMEVAAASKDSEQAKFAARTAEALSKIADKLNKPMERPRYDKGPAPQRREERPRREEKPRYEERPRPVERIVERQAPRRRGGLKPLPKSITERIVEKRREEPKKGFMQRIKERVVPGQGEKPVSKAVSQAIKQKVAGTGASKEQIANIEKKLGELLRKYDIPDSAVTDHIRGFDSNSLVQDFQKLISLIETKKDNATVELIKPAPGFDIKTGVISKKREKIIGKEKEIKSATIETNFDRVLNLVQVKGIINLNEVSKQLNINKKKAQECAEILERGRLIRMIYPPIGSVKLVYPQYLEWKAKEKKKKRKKKK